MINTSKLNSGALYPELADTLRQAGASQVWSSTQEMQECEPGSYPHGMVDDCFDGSEHFQRIWDNIDGVWLNVYA